ncbi:MAG: hypothetical protein JO081_03830 [Alphaproteobacteria bacterium]|nr:hypothetical protein [Alphaproteobacteria bacterium]
MAKLSIALEAAGLMAALLVAGCEGLPEAATPPPTPLAAPFYPPWTLNQSPERIALRWYPDATPSAAAEQVARAHCGSWNRSAVLVSDTRDGSAEIAEYQCR